MIITAGKTNVSLYVYFVDDDGGTAPGEPTTGKLFSDIETGGSASYARQGAARTDFTLITLASASAAHADGGFILVDDTNMPGLYRVDVPDAAFATGVDFVIIQLVMAAANNSIMRPLLVDITDVDLREGVRAGLTALPNAAADAAGGLPISDAGGLDLDTQLAATNEVTAARMGALTDWIDGGRLDLIIDAINVIAADWTNGGRLDLLLDAVSTTADLLDKVGAVDEAAAAGDPSATESVMQYVKQLVNILVGTAGVVTFPAEAAPGNGVSLAEVIRAIHVDTNTTLQGELDGIQADTEDIQSRIPAALVGGRIDASLDATGFEAAAVDLIWDEVLTGATHNVNTSAGKRLRQVDAAFQVASGTAQAGGAATITLEAGSSSVDNIFRGDRIIITEGTGAGEHDICTSYDGCTLIATVAETWITTPDATSVYEIVPASVDVETWQHQIVTASGALPDVNVEAKDDIDFGATEKASINTEVVDTLQTDTLTATAQGAPPTTPTLAAALMTIYDALVHKIDIDSGFKEFYNNAGTVIWKKALSDDATNYIEAESETGP